MQKKLALSFQNFIADIGRLRLFLALLACVSLVLLYWLLAQDSVPPDKVLQKNQYITDDFLKALVPNLVAVPLIYILSVLAVTRANERIGQQERKDLAETIKRAVLDELYARHDSVIKGAAIIHSDIDSIRWDLEISKSSTIDVCVQGWDRWIKTHAKEFAHFFARGGRLNLYLPDCTDQSQNDPILLRLPDYDIAALNRNVENTWQVLRGIFLQYPTTTGELNIYFCKNLFWYCAVQFDGHSLFISQYESKRIARVQSPTTEVSLLQHPSVRKWIDKELDFLRTHANRVVSGRK